ncbi:MAG TPA: LysM peptidoglycan-binding domain-containing protein [Bacteroidetes bacterium]|nr:LysM peptidoglycan-binding domain-containing protein [Bacteroidota bacterium]
MMRTTIVLLLAVLLLGMAFPASAQQKMTYEEYQAELARWAEREQAAQAQIDQLNGELEALRNEIAGIEQQIATTWQEIYAMLAVTQDDLNAYAGELDVIAAEIDAWKAVSPEDIYQRQDELDDLMARVKEVAARNPGKLSQYRDTLDQLQAQVQGVRARMAKPRTLMYTVARGDYLWKIAGMPEYFGDPWKWMRIYSVNADQIDDPDLIYPDQRLTVPIDVDRNKQYLVARGDFLYKIAEQLYRDPFQWRKLYEANTKVVGEDPNLIYPETILALPGR